MPEKTAVELMRELANDSAYQVMRRGKAAKQASIIEAAKAEQVRLRADLARVGVQINEIWDLVMRKEPYPQAVPILLAHLRNEYSDKTKEGIARSLAIPDASRVWPELAARYVKPDIGRKEKEGLAVALSGASSDANVPRLIEIASNRENGPSRILLLSALRRSKSYAARQALRDLADDPDLAKEIASWSGGEDD